MASPLQYFSFPLPTKSRDILEDRTVDKSANPLIIGGGGFLGRETFTLAMQRLTLQKRGTVIGWGLGHNGPLSMSSELVYPGYVDHFDLVGIRDYGQPYHYVPCPSCLSPLFDKEYELKREVSIYSHGDPRQLLVLPENNAPRMVNWSPAEKPTAKEALDYFSKVIQFLGESETILTNSYHGVYWGILLKRKVIAFPFTTKFHHFKYPIVLANTENYREKMKSLSQFPEALEESRSANKDFYKLVINRLD